MKRLFLLCILLLAGCTSGGYWNCDNVVQNCEGVPNITPIRNETEVGALVQQVLNGHELSGYVYGEPVYDPKTGLWLSETDLNTGFTLLTYVNDSSLTVHETLFRAPIPDLDVPPGSIKIGNESCEKDGRIQVYIFEDPYCPACISNTNYVSSVIEKFASDPVDFRWRYLLTHSLAPGGIIDNYGSEVVELAAKYYICAEEQGMIYEFKTCNNGLFNERLQTAEEEIPSVADDLDGCAEDIGLDTEVLNACLDREDIENRISEDYNLTQSFGLISTPSTTVNCMYGQKLSKLMLTLCSMNESFKGCT